MRAAASSRRHGGRTTLAGEGLQHQDGNSLQYAMAYPTCQAYDPRFAYEVAVIVLDGIRRMFFEEQDIFYYITLLTRIISIRSCRWVLAKASPAACTGYPTATWGPRSPRCNSWAADRSSVKSCESATAGVEVRRWQHGLQCDQLQGAL